MSEMPTGYGKWAAEKSRRRISELEAERDRDLNQRHADYRASKRPALEASNARWRHAYNRERVFQRALRTLLERGWWEGPSEELGDTKEEGPKGEVCIATAVRLACKLVDEDCAREAFRHLKATLGMSLEEGSLATWNDDPARTWEEVWTALRAADTTWQ